MAITYVGGQIAGVPGRTTALTVNFALTGGSDAAPLAGDLVVITYVVGNVSDVTLAIRNAGGTDYTLMGSELYQNDTFDTNQRTAYRFMPGTTETQFVLTETATGGTGATTDAGHYTVHVFRGVDPSTPMDVAVVTAGGIDGGGVDPGSITPTTSGAVIYIAGGCGCDTGTTMTADYLTAFLAGTQADNRDAAIGAGYLAWDNVNPYNGAAFGNPNTAPGSSWTCITAALRPTSSGDVELVVADATHAHEAENLALVQAGTLTVADATHGHTADNIVLTQPSTLTLGTNCGFVTTAPTADPQGSATVIDGAAEAIHDTSPSGSPRVTEVGFYLAATGGTLAPARIAAFSDAAAGEPEIQQFITSGIDKGQTANVWVRFRGLAWDFSASTPYWFGAHVEAHGGTASSIDAGGSGGTGRAHLNSAADMPSDWGTSDIEDSNGLAAIYAVVVDADDAPVLDSQVAQQTSPSTAAVRVYSNKADGTIYAVATTSSTPPSAAQIKAGQDHTGAAAAGAVNQAVTTPGDQNLNVAGLSASTGYYAHVVQTDGDTQDSNVVTTAQITTPAADTTAFVTLRSNEVVDTLLTLTSDPFAFSPDSIAVLHVAVRSDATVTLANSHGVTWELVSHHGSSTIRRGLVYWARIGSAPVIDEIAITLSATARFGISAVDIRGAATDTDPADVIRMIVEPRTHTLLTSFKTYMQKFTDATNNVAVGFSFVGMDDDAFTAGSGWTELGQASTTGNAGDGVTCYSQWRVGEGLTHDFSWEDAAHVGSFVGLEVRAVGAPAFPAMKNMDLLARVTGTGSSLVTASVSPTADRLVYAVVSSGISSNGGGGFAPSGVSGAGLTFANVAEIDYDTIAAPDRTLSLWVATSATPTPGAITATFGASQTDGAVMVVFESDGVVVAGGAAAAIIQSDTVAEDSDTAIEAALSAFGGANATLVVCDLPGTDQFAVLGDGLQPVTVEDAAASGSSIYTVQAAWRASEDTTPGLGYSVSGDGSTPGPAALIAVEVDMEGAEAVELVVAEALHGHDVDNLTLTQAHALALDDALHGHEADNVALTQANVLTVADALHDHAADNLALTQANVLAVDDATHDHTAEAVLLTQANTLAVDDALHGHEADNLDLTQGFTLTLEDAFHDHEAESLTLTQANQLAVFDALHPHEAENVVLSQHSALLVNDALHAHTADNVVLQVFGLELDLQPPFTSRWVNPNRLSAWMDPTRSAAWRDPVRTAAWT